MKAALVATLLTLLLAACGDSEKTAVKPLELGQSTTLKRGTIDTDLTAERMTDPYVLDGAPKLPNSQHYVGVALKWVDNGVPFHHDWPRFALVSDSDKVTKVAVLTPLKKTFPGKPDKGQPMTQMVALAIADGSKPKGLVLGSADDRWPFTASWSLERARR